MMSIKQLLSFGRPTSDPVPAKDRAEWFKECCRFVCSNFQIDKSNRNVMNQIFLYMEKDRSKLDPEKVFCFVARSGPENLPLCR